MVKISGRLAALCGVGTLALTACGGASPAAQAPASSPAATSHSASTSSAASGSGKLTTVTFEYPTIATGADVPFAYGVESGIYKKYGLNVKYSFGTGSGNTTAQVGSGKVEFGGGDAVSVLKLAAGHVPVVMISGDIQQTEAAIIVAANSPATSLSTLSKISIGASPGSSALLLLPAFLKAAKIPASSLHIDNMAFSAQWSSLYHGTVQGLVSFWDQVQAVEASKGLKTRAFKFSSVGVDPLNLGIVTNQTEIQQHPAIVKAFTAATQASLIAAAKHPNAAVAALIKEAHGTAPAASVLKQEVLAEAQMYQTPNDKGHPVGWMSPADWKATETLAQKYLGLKSAVPLSQVYTDQFISNNP